MELLRTNDDRAVALIFRRYYPYLCQVIYKVIPDANLAEDIAQDVFYDLWRRRARLDVTTSLTAYLRRAALNRALNYLRDQKIKFDEEEKAPTPRSYLPGAGQQMEEAELQQAIHRAIDALPERCRAVFMLSRFEELSYQEIADRLDISIKTVENQISKALKNLREALKNYLNAG